MQPGIARLGMTGQADDGREEAKRRIKEIMSRPALEPVQNEFSRIPLYGNLRNRATDNC